MKIENIVLTSCVVATLVLAILIVIKMRRCSCAEKYVKFPQADKRKLFGSVDCAYALNGGNTAYCNEWLDAYRQDLQCANDGYKICCQRALSCCNEIATCGNGNDCRNPAYMPTKENSIRYDQNVNIDE